MAGNDDNTVRAINERLRNESLLFMSARVQAVKLGHFLGSFQQIDDSTLYGAICPCGQCAFVDIKTGAYDGLALVETCQGAKT